MSLSDPEWRALLRLFLLGSGVRPLSGYGLAYAGLERAGLARFDRLDGARVVVLTSRRRACRVLVGGAS